MKKTLISVLILTALFTTTGCEDKEAKATIEQQTARRKVKSLRGLFFLKEMEKRRPDYDSAHLHLAAVILRLLFPQGVFYQGRRYAS